MELTGEYHADCSMLLRELAFHKEQLDLYKKRVNERYEKIHELRAEVEALRRLVRDLRDIGTFAVVHDFDGDCPDKKCTRHWRDSSCPACKVLMAADDALRGEDE